MKIKLSIIFFIFYFLNLSMAKADRGVVVMHEAPLFKSMDYQSPIVQYVRQGTIIYVHKKHIDEFNEKETIESNTYRGKNGNRLVLNNQFYETLDKNANPAFIPAQFVKLITNDPNESKQPMENYRFDPTDYRHGEPLPKNYPLYEPKQFRSGLNLSMGSPIDVNYNYPGTVSYKDLGYFAGIDFFYSKNLIETPQNRAFIGGNFFIRRIISEYELSDIDTVSTEQKLIYGIGPNFIYDIFKRDNLIISMNSSVLLNFHNYHLFQDKRNNVGEVYLQDESVFQGYSISMHPGFTIQKAFVENLYLALGSKVSIHFPYTLKNKTGYEHEEMWAENEYKSSFSYNFDFHLGIQGTY